MGNVFIGLFPLLFSGAVLLVSGKSQGREEVQHLIHDGIIVLVSIAIIGSVLFDFILSGYTLKVVTIFVISIIPSLQVSFVSMNYILIIFKQLDGSCFEVGSRQSIFITTISVAFSIFTKTALYYFETKNKKS